MSTIVKFGTVGNIGSNDYVLIRADQVAAITPEPDGDSGGCHITLTNGQRIWVAVPADESAGRLGFQIV